MDDLNGLNVNLGSSKSPVKQSPSGFVSPSAISSQTLASLNAQSISRPVSSQRSTPGLIGASRTPVNDSFSSLLSLGSGKTATNLTLEERQKQLIEERRRQIDEQQKRLQSDSHHLDSLGSFASPGRTSSGHGVLASVVAPVATAPGPGPTRTNDKVGDILATFNPSTKVDKSSHLPPPSTSPAISRGHTPIVSKSQTPVPLANGFPSFNNDNYDDDDPFGLGSMPKKSQSTPSQPAHDDVNDIDILGDLGKPVQEKKTTTTGSSTFRPSAGDVQRQSAPDADPKVAELVDMGFPADRARAALDASDHDIQAAVSWLINKAHQDSKPKSKPTEDRGRSPRNRRSSSAKRRAAAGDDTVPQWMRPRSRSANTRRKSSAGNDKDVAQYAAEFSTAFFKSANTLWKQGQKKVQKAVADFQHEGGDGGQPKWMREPSTVDHSSGAKSAGQNIAPNKQRPSEAANTTGTVTNEALLLESDNARPIKPNKSSNSVPNGPTRTDLPQRQRPAAGSDSQARKLPDPRFQQTHRNTVSATSARQKKFDDDAETANAYVSSARRRRTPAPPTQAPAPEVDLFNAPLPVKNPVSAAAKPSFVPSQNIDPRPAKIARSVPNITPTDRQTSDRHRKAGTEAYKRGDYAAAHESFTAALVPLPPTHTLTIVVLCNHAMTALKIGDPKAAIADADSALNIIGANKGEGETIEIDDNETTKPMKEFYGKAMTRKAEALEHREQWLEAGRCWRLCVEVGFGGAVSTQGRDRCESAARAAVSSTSSPPAAPRPPRPIAAAATKRSASGPAATATAPSPSRAATTAVRALRALTAQAERADDEKFALSDAVDARIASWKGGKSDNLRALLASLDSVLWESAGWKKCSMAELVLVPRVKIIYMKAIAKVHPDKISQDATTEQRMISSSVFATLNEAWDKFKKDNGL